MIGLAAALALAGCAGGRRTGTIGLATAPSRSYPPPGPPDDPWGPYIMEAARRFSVPDQWVRAVMRQESGGQQQAVSSAGAIGLMQLMPDTYAGLRTENALGDDPFEPHDNILAGTAYLRQMYDRYGAPGFLAAYNAGPGRVDAFLASGDPLPDETVSYVAAIAPRLGPGTPLTGPIAAFDGLRSTAAVPTARSFAVGCDADLAYDPDRPCRALERQATLAAPLAEPPALPAPEPPQDRTLLAQSAPAAQPPEQTPPEQTPPEQSRPEGPDGTWAIQVGAFASADLAQAMAERARIQQAALLAQARVSLPTTTPFGGRILYRARLTELSAASATLACRELNARQLPCIVVRPGAPA